jgi:hypothetical protein
MEKQIFDLYEIIKKKIEISKRTKDEWFALYFRRALLITINTLFLTAVISAAVLV